MRRLVLVLLLALVAACTAKPPYTASQTQPPDAVSQTPPPAAPASQVAVSTGTEMPVAPTETAVAPEVNPPGDIPDSQAFVSYKSAAGGYQLDVPEGWARTETGTAVSFVDKFDGVGVTVGPASAAPTAASARANEAKQIASSGHAVTITDVSAVTMASGPAVIIRYTSNSEPNAVTNKRVRLENEAVLYFKNGKQAMLTLWAPQGADNVDQWDRMSKSFRLL